MIERDAIIIKWPRVFFPVMVTALFGTICPLAFIGMVYGKLQLGAFPDVGWVLLGFALLVLVLFTFVSIKGFFSSLANYKEPFTVLKADENGVSLAVKKAGELLIPWREIKELNKDNISLGDHHHSDTLHIILYSGSRILFSDSSILGSWHNSEKEVHLLEDALDCDLSELVEILNGMHKRYTDFNRAEG